MLSSLQLNESIYANGFLNYLMINTFDLVYDDLVYIKIEINVLIVTILVLQTEISGLSMATRNFWLKHELNT